MLKKDTRNVIKTEDRSIICGNNKSTSQTKGKASRCQMKVRYIGMMQALTNTKRQRERVCCQRIK